MARSPQTTPIPPPPTTRATQTGSPTHSPGTQIARRSSSPKSAPGQPHPRPTAAARSSTTRPPALNAPGSHEGTPQRPLSRSPASSSTSQTRKTAGCLAVVSGTVSGVATGEFLFLFLARSPLFLRFSFLYPCPYRIDFVHSLHHFFVPCDGQLIHTLYSSSGAPLGEVFYPCPKHNRHGDSLPMFTFDIAYVTALGAPNTTTTADDLSTPSSSSSSSSSLTLSPSSSQASSLRTLRIDHPPSSSPRISTSTRHSHSHPPIVVTPNNPYVPTGAYPSSLPTVAGARPVIMARTHHPAQRPPPLPRPPRSPSCPGTPHDSEEDYSGSEEEITGASGSGGSYSDDSLPMTATGNPTPSPPRSNSQSSLQSC